MIAQTHRVLSFFLGRRDIYRPVMFSRNEVFCGPDVGDQTDPETGRLVTARTPVGAFDAATFATRLAPEDQQPDVVVVKADGTRRLLPRNLDRLPGIKVLVLGDSHHQLRPLKTLLDYASREPFDIICTDHDRHHLHWFQEAGFPEVHWMPLLNLHLHETPDDLERLPRLAFTGGLVSDSHRYRRYLIGLARRANLPVDAQILPQAESARFFAESVVSFNCSLNGDLNLRIGEVAGAGGCLLTDRLAPQSGLSTLLREGREMLCYGSPEELVSLARDCLASPAAALAIARAGRDRIRREHNAEVKALEFNDLVFDRRSPDAYCLPQRRTSVPVRRGPDLERRRRLYETIQDLHRLSGSLTLRLPTDLLDDRDDFVDLPRLRLARDDAPLPPFDTTPCHMRHHGVAVLTLAEIPSAEDGLPPQVLRRAPWETILLFDGDGVLPGALSPPVERLRAWGYTAQGDRPEVFTLDRPDVLLRVLLDAGDRSALEAIVPALDGLPLPGACIRACHAVLADSDMEAERLTLLLRATMIRRADPALLTTFAKTLEPIDATNAAMAWSEVGRVQPPAAHPDVLAKLDRLEASHPEIRAILDSLPVTARGIKAEARSKGNPMRILTVTNFYPPDELGGYGRYMWELVRGLRARGHMVRILCGLRPDTAIPPDERDRHDVHRDLILFGDFGARGIEINEALRPIAETRNAGAVLRAAVDFQADICLIGNLDLIGTRLLHAMLDAPYPAVHTMGNPGPYSPAEIPDHDHYLACPLSHAQSEGMIESGLHFPHTRVLSPGVRVDLFHRVFMPSLDLPRLCFAGLNMQYKGLHLAIDCFIRLHALAIPFEATVIGGTLTPDFLEGEKARLQRAGLGDRVQVLGERPHVELPTILANHNIFLFPSQFEEPFGMAQVEAMASGLCVIGSAAGGSGEVLRHGYNGLVHERQSAKAMTNAVQYLVEHPDDWRALASQGRLDAWKYSVEVFAAGIEQALSDTRAKLP
ncbi:MAG: glycosyltransferase [Rhodospirillum sp.]|nr:glycosyltransferase [Rhodospirillum sp.]MCF8491544.1 glycosyltransferase [Rhodospirillum sp.]